MAVGFKVDTNIISLGVSVTAADSSLGLYGESEGRVRQFSDSLRGLMILLYLRR